MLNCFRVIFLLTVSAALSGHAFSLLGPGGAQANPAKPWQLPGANGGWNIGYDLIGDIGAPMDLLEAYRWNVPVVTYAFDESFIRFFGTRGVREIEKAFAVLNALPPATQMSKKLEEFPLSTSRQNFEATQLGLVDIKTATLSLMMEQLGLAAPERWVWSIRQRYIIANTTNYAVVQYNYDPVPPHQRSPYVNGNLYTYEIIETPTGIPGAPIAEAVESLVPAEAIRNLTLASGQLVPGFFSSGLTRDDAGGLRFLLSPRNLVAESLLPTVSPGQGSGWLPVLGTNFLGTATNGLGTNQLVTAGVRGGINKVRFQRVNFDSLLSGGFVPITNSYVDRVISTNSQMFEQNVQRSIVRPDIVFTVADLGITFDFFRTGTTAWINDDLLTPDENLGGPGVITGPVAITFNMLEPMFFNTSPDFLDEASAGRGITWASFDGTTNAPVIYPLYLHYTIDDIRQAARSSP